MQIGLALGMSKNAVVGKAHRLLLPARPSLIKREPGARADAYVRIARSRMTPAPLHCAPVVKLPEVPRRYVTGAETCRWPIGNPGAPGFHFCDAPGILGKPYCAAHDAVAYIRPRAADGAAA